MKHFIALILCLLLFAGCTEEKKSPATESKATTSESVDKAGAALKHVEALFAEHRYQECCEAIKALRKDFPSAIEARKRCVNLWDEAQLGIAEEELANAESRLAEAERKLKTAKDRTTRLLLENEVDDQKARREAQQQIVQMLREKIENRPTVK